MKVIFILKKELLREDNWFWLPVCCRWSNKDALCYDPALLHPRFSFAFLWHSFKSFLSFCRLWMKAECKASHPQKTLFWIFQEDNWIWKCQVNPPRFKHKKTKISFLSLLFFLCFDCFRSEFLSLPSSILFVSLFPFFANFFFLFFSLKKQRVNVGFFSMQCHQLEWTLVAHEEAILNKVERSGFNFFLIFSKRREIKIWIARNP